MLKRTPIERAVATYCEDWPKVKADQPGYAKVNPETLGNSTPPDFTFRYIDIGSVSEGIINWRIVERIRFADSPSRARRVVRPGDTMICTVRPILKSHAFANWLEQEPTICSTGFAVVRCVGGLVPEFFKHLPFAEQISCQLIAWECGTNYPAVNERDIRQLAVPCPPKEEQAAIARVLDAVDTAVERTQRTMDEAKNVKRALLQKFFYEALGETAYADRPRKKLPFGWELISTEKLLAEEPKNGVSPESSSQPPGVLTFSIAAIRDGRVNFRNKENLKYAQIPDKVAKLFCLKRGDLLIVRGNANPDLVGKAGIVDRVPEGCIYPDITKRIVFRTDATRNISPEFAVLVWNHPIVHNQVLRRAKTSNGTLKINNRDVKQIVMPVPPDEEQVKIVKLAAAVDAKINSLDQVFDAQEQLKRALMHDLLTGRVRVKPCQPREAILL